VSLLEKACECKVIFSHVAVSLAWIVNSVYLLYLKVLSISERGSLNLLCDVTHQEPVLSKAMKPMRNIISIAIDEFDDGPIELGSTSNNSPYDDASAAHTRVFQRATSMLHTDFHLI